MAAVFASEGRIAYLDNGALVVKFDTEHELTVLGEQVFEDGVIIPNPELAKIFVVYSPYGPVMAVNASTGKVTKLLSDKHLGRDQIAWCGWHEASATGQHLLLLTTNGSLLMLNASSGRAEVRFKVRSPEDHTLRCVTATLRGEVLWVALENGDVLAVSPILPFPARIEEILEQSETEGIPSRTRNFYTCLRAEQQDGIVKKPPRDFTLLTPTSQGPFYMRPEPNSYDSPSFILSFQHQDLDFLTVVSGKSLDIYLLETPIMPCWEESTPGDLQHQGTLTLIESIILNDAPCCVKYHRETLLVGTKNALLHVKLVWLTEIAQYLQDESCADLPQLISKVERLGDVNSVILDILVEGSNISCLGEKLQVNRFVIPPEALHKIKLPSMMNFLNQPDAIASFKPLVGKPLSLPKGVLPKLKIPDRLSTLRFPEEVDEDALEEVLDTVYKWRTQTIVQCSLLAEGLKRKAAIIDELAMKQRDWGAQVTKRGNTLLNSSKSAEHEISSLESRVIELSQRSSHSLSKDTGGLDQLRQRLAAIQSSITAILEQAPRNNVMERLSSQTGLLDHIQEKIKTISINN